MTEKIDQFGHGIICPFQRDGKGDYANAGGKVCLKSDVSELLGIIGPTPTQPGELPWRTSTGSRLNALRHRNMHKDMIAATVGQYAGESVRRDEKRVRVGPTTVTKDPPNYPENTMLAEFSYTPLGMDRPDKVGVPIEE